MASRYKFYFVILSIIGSLLSYGTVRAQEVPPSDNTAEQQTVTGPEQHPIRLVSFDPWVIQGEVMGAVASYVYDDVSTERPTDYWEIYNQEGELLAASWFDSVGIRRTAVDRGIVEEKDQLEGILVLVVDGDPA
jgi:hypothetical protein